MKRSRHKHPPSTFGVYKPGVGYTITRANIAAAQAERVSRGLPDHSPESLVRAFRPQNPEAKGLPVSPRHLARAARLMGGA